MTSCSKRSNLGTGRPVIALMTDFGNHDSYVGQMKGSILAINPDVILTDLNHSLTPFDLHEASYLLGKSSKYFPPGTIFVVVVDPGVGSERKAILIQTQDGKYYIGPDNGIFTHVINSQKIQSAVELTKTAFFRPGAVSQTFHGRDIFGPVAAHLAGGTDIGEFGEKLENSPTLLEIPKASQLGNTVSGEVVYIDHYGNIITNIPGALLGETKKGNLLKCKIKNKNYSLPFLEKYNDAPEKRAFCLINSDDEFEIAVPSGNASKSLGIKIGDSVILQ